jgi:Arc/MetJ-type ribon-helix-helix transcriptional regulator
METLVTLRLDAKTKRRIARVAQRRKISKSEVIRQALEAWPEFHDSDQSPYEAMTKFIGVLNGGNPKRSENGGAKFTKFLKEKRRRS